MLVFRNTQLNKLYTVLFQNNQCYTGVQGYSDEDTDKKNTYNTDKKNTLLTCVISKLPV